MTPTAKWPRQLTLSNYEIEVSLPGFQTTVRSVVQVTVVRCSHLSPTRK